MSPAGDAVVRGGVAFALLAGILWGLIFVAPLLMPEYPAPLISVGRYLCFGLAALPLGWVDRSEISQLSRADWVEALKLVTIGNLLYYVLLASAIQRAGAPLPTMIVGILPVTIAISANWRDRKRNGFLSWLQLLPSLLLIGSGIACVNQVELKGLNTGPAVNRLRYLSGVLCALGALACWTWYPLRNADWLHSHPSYNPRAWSTAQGLAILPLALAGYLALWITSNIANSALSMPLGPRPLTFVSVAAATGLLSTWLASWCWNRASQRLPTVLSGQLLVFETLAALTYVFLLCGRKPAPEVIAGIALLITGILWAVRSTPE